jgi:HSP20 family protein
MNFRQPPSRETLTYNSLDNGIVNLLASACARKRGTDSSQQEVRIMTIARRPSPFGELLSLRQAMDRLFEDSFVRAPGWGAFASDASQFPLDVRMTADDLVVEGQLPGIKPDDVDITIENGRLTIRAEASSDDERQDGDFLVREIRRGAFSRSVALPSGLEADKAEATFDDGVLTLRIPKAEQVKPRQIRITPVTSNGRPDEPAVDATAGSDNG